MKILCITNGEMLEKNEGLFINKHTGQFFIELSKELEKVQVFQFSMRYPDNDGLANYNIKNNGLDIVAIKRNKNKIVPYIKACWIGYKIIRTCNFLYVFYPGIICTIFALFAIFQKKAFGIYVRGEYGIRSRISKFLFRKALISLTISPEFTALIRGLGGNAETIRPMIEESEADIVVNRTYVAKDKYKLLYVGRIELAKGTYDLITALKLLIDQGINNISLDMVGDGPDAKEIRRLVIDFNLSEYVNFHGTITDRNILKKFYREDDLFILPTHHEGFPRVLYESMIAGLPILTTFVGAIAHLMKDGYNCYRIFPKNPVGLAQTIVAVLQNYETIAGIAINGTNTIIDYLKNKKETHAQQLMRIVAEKGHPASSWKN